MTSPSSKPVKDPLARSAEAVAKLLEKRQTRLVCAESCTSGMIAAALGRVSGISMWFCGSAVTYRESVKTAWLDVSPDDLARHSAVSEPVARQMAIGVLKNTPEANWSAAITGHLGPNAPADMDGVVYIAIARRQGKRLAVVEITRRKLTAKTRLHRQLQAASFTLRQFLATLRQTT